MVCTNGRPIAVPSAGTIRHYKTLISAMTPKKLPATLSCALALLYLMSHSVRAASDLRLAPDLSFIDDSSSSFPIAGNSIDSLDLPWDSDAAKSLIPGAW